MLVKLLWVIRMPRLDVVHVLETMHGSTSMPCSCVRDEKVALSRFFHTHTDHMDHT